ncbi:MAG: prepilin-type N-terminal cleavage/methylation domain-containing protein [Desulfobacterales bacterium]|nr:prepilin-type N-terminal cleavage/methylation domain-containing protein [Desulfobacterales bacterium]
MLRSKKGYTLIELVVVVLLIGMTMGLTIPRFRQAVLTDPLKGATRKMVGIIKGIRSEAIQRHKVYSLYFDLESDLFWIEPDDIGEEERELVRSKAASLPGDVRVRDVRINGKGKKTVGEAAIRFNEKGYIQGSLIHLNSADGREFTLMLSPFLGKVKVFDKYVDIEDSLWPLW